MSLDDELAAGHLRALRPLRDPLVRDVVAWFAPRAGSVGVDVGCGAGFDLLPLASAVGPDGRVIALDRSTAMLRLARAVTDAEGVAAPVSFVAGDAQRLDLDGARVDWLWSNDCLGYPSGDLADAFRAIRPQLNPGGRVLLLGWTSQSLLPGWEPLEARLNATRSQPLAWLTHEPAHRHFLRAPDALRAAGFVDVRARTFARTLLGPLEPAERAALLDLFAMCWGNPAGAAHDDDGREYARRCDGRLPDCVLDLPGYCGFFTCTAFSATVE